MKGLLPSHLTQFYILTQCNIRCNAVHLHQTYRIPQGQLSFTHSAKARGQDLPISKKYGPHWPGAFMDLLSHLGVEIETGWLMDLAVTL